MISAVYQRSRAFVKVSYHNGFTIRIEGVVSSLCMEDVGAMQTNLTPKQDV